MFTDPVVPVKVLFYWSKAVLGNFYWPGASVSLLVSSPGIENICFSNTLLAQQKCMQAIYTIWPLEKKRVSRSVNFCTPVLFPVNKHPFFYQNTDIG